MQQQHKLECLPFIGSKSPIFSYLLLDRGKPFRISGMDPKTGLKLILARVILT